MNGSDFDFFNNIGASNYLKGLQSSSAMPNSGFGGGSPIGGTGGLGWNMDTMKLGLGGLQTIGNLWNSFQAQKLAKETFKYQKNITDQNMTNSLQSYNTSLADRIRARTFTEGGTQASADEYIEKNSLRRQY